MRFKILECLDAAEAVNPAQQSTHDQTMVTIVPHPMISHQNTTQTVTSLCECDGPWWGFCCLSCWFFGIGGLVADFKIHGTGTWNGWGLAVMGLLKWGGIILLLFSFFTSGPIGMVKKKFD